MGQSIMGRSTTRVGPHIPGEKDIEMQEPCRVSTQAGVGPPWVGPLQGRSTHTRIQGDRDAGAMQGKSTSRGRSTMGQSTMGRSTTRVGLHIPGYKEIEMQEPFRVSPQAGVGPPWVSPPPG